MGIIVLDQVTIDKIAAGEVIENPASVVKELVENSIDAGASLISVEIKNGGTEYIRVTDDGCGIGMEDIKNAFVKHATSKIESIDDVTGVETLGFRGEALPSIASVSRTSLTTRTKDSNAGYTYKVEGGKPKDLEEVGVPEGTTMVVEELFYNTPARKKFLKNASSEGAIIAALMEKFALSRPDISFKFVSDGKEKLNTTGNGNLKEVIYAIYGKEITDNLVEVTYESDDLVINGFIGKPSVSRGNRSFEHYAINGRYIKNDALTEAIEEAYKGYIMLHNFPFVALLFNIDPLLLDVNVHPAKREFRLTTSEDICARVTDIIRDAIENANIVPDVTPGSNSKQETGNAREAQADATEEGDLQQDIENVNSAQQADDGESAQDGKTQHFIHEDSFESSVMADGLFGGVDEVTAEDIEASMEQKEVEVAERIASPDAAADEILMRIKGKSSHNRFADLSEKKNFIQQEIPDVKSENKYRLIGQLFATYWLIEADDTFYMMDQHAAHEKILYERLMKTISDKKPQTQMMTVPEVIDITPETKALLKEDSTLFESFKSLGYELEVFGDKSVKVTGVPAGLPVMDYRQMLVDLLDGLSDKKESGLSKKTKPQVMVEKVASMSCKAAIKGNDRISESEALELLDEMMKAENPYNCPHGRPTLIAMSKNEIEKKFKRIV